MGAMTNLLVKDDTPTTAVEHTFVPVTDTPNPIWRDTQSGVSVAGQPTISMMNERLKSGTFRTTVKLDVPVMEQLGTAGTQAGYVAAPKVAHTISGVFTMYSSDRATNQNRADTLRMLVGILQGASSTTNTGVLAQSSAANAFLASSLPITQAIIGQISPN